MAKNSHVKAIVAHDVCANLGSIVTGDALKLDRVPFENSRKRLSVQIFHARVLRRRAKLVTCGAPFLLLS